MRHDRKHLNDISRVILLSSIRVHKELGPGLLESIYENCLKQELEYQGLKVRQQVFLPIFYRGKRVKQQLRIDLLVDDQIVLEVKAVEDFLPVHEAQIISYLKLADKRLGFLVNFNVPVIKEGFRRFVNHF